MSSAAGAPLSLPSKAEYLSKRYGDRRDRKERKKKHKKEEKKPRRTNGRRGGSDDNDDDDSFVGAHRRRDKEHDDDDDDEDRESEEDRPVIVEGSGDARVEDDAGLRRRYDLEDNSDDSDASKRGEARGSRTLTKRRYDSDDEDDRADRVRRGGGGPSPPPVASSGVEPIGRGTRQRRYDSDDDDDDKGREKRRYDSDDDDDGSRDSSDPRGERTASGHRAGLQSGRTFGKSEKSLLRARRDEAQRTVDAHGVGETVYRDKSSLRRHDPKGDADARKSAAGLTPEEQAAVLNVGRVQREAMEERQQRMEQLAASSFARHQDDEGLEEMRKSAVREGDPMAAYAASSSAGKKKGAGAKASASHDAGMARPVYKGPPPKPNRYGIRPGFRWDGVDRGNGFEDRLLAKRYNQQHQKELAYRMSSADM